MPKEMTNAQIRFVELDRQLEQYKQFLKERGEAMQAVADEIGTGGMWQDDDGVVYQINVCRGKYVHFETLECTRTKRQGEEKSPHPLAIKTAKAAGFEVE